MAEAFVYLLRGADGSLYCGWTNDLQRRLRAHNAGTGSKYTRTRRPVALVWFEACESRETAMSREWHLKRLTREEKIQLIEERESHERDSQTGGEA